MIYYRKYLDIKNAKNNDARWVLMEILQILSLPKILLVLSFNSVEKTAII